MVNEALSNLLWKDSWDIVGGETDSGSFILRYRGPLPDPKEVEAHIYCLRVVWPYAAEGTGALPSDKLGSRLERFENCLASALEEDGHGVIVAVLTFDGARQWVVYTQDVEECGSRLSLMPQEKKPYPIELDAFEDPKWDYLRKEVLKNFLP